MKMAKLVTYRLFQINQVLIIWAKLPIIHLLVKSDRLILFYAGRRIRQEKQQELHNIGDLSCFSKPRK